MPKRFVKYSRTDPARTILWSVSVLSGAAQTVAMALAWPLGIINFILVVPVCIWGVWASTKNNHRHMKYTSFWLSLLWTWTGLSRLLMIDGIGELLWLPFLIVGVVMAVVYLYMSYQERIGGVG